MSYNRDNFRGRQGGFGQDRGGARFNGHPRGGFGGGGRGGGRFRQDGPPRNGGGFRDKQQPGENLRKVAWDQYTLVPFEKHFYNPHPNIANADPREVDKFRGAHQISIQRYVHHDAS